MSLPGLIALLMVAVAGALDLVTGPEIASSIFYELLILFVALQ